MQRFRQTGLWAPLSRRQRERVELEYDRCVRMAAGACEGVLTYKLGKFCVENFSEFVDDWKALQFHLARQLGQFYLANGRLPRRGSAREAYLYQFLCRIRRRSLFSKTKRYLNRVIPGWRYDPEEEAALHLLKMRRVSLDFQ